MTTDRKSSAKDLYQAGYAIDKIAEMLQASRSSVHAWVHEDGDYRVRPWTVAEDTILRKLYAEAGTEAIDLDRTAKVFGRSRAAVACRANALRLTNQNGLSRAVTREKLSSTVKLQCDFGRATPPSFAGHTHSSVSRAKIGSAAKGRATYERTAKHRKRLSEIVTERLTSGGNVYSRSRRGRRADLGGSFFRSAWEANVARWLTFHGRKWLYEPKTFWFETVRRGARSYTPDFFLPDENRYIEVKGWMDAKSRTKLKRMAKYFPDVQIEVIDAKRYREICTYAAVIPKWEGA